MKHTSGWNIGLGIGIVAIVLAIIFGVKFISGELSAGKADTVVSLVKAVDRYIAEGTLSTEQVEILRELAAIVKSKDASMAAVLLSHGVVQNAMKNGRISERGWQNIIVVREWLKKKKGNVTFVVLGRFYNDNPAIKDVMELETMRKK